MARQLGRILVDMGFIDDGQLEMLVEEHGQQPSVQIGKVAEDMGLVIDTQLVQALAEQFDLQIVNFGDISITEEILDEISEAMAQMYRAVPVQLNGNLLTVAVSHPENITVADELRTFLGRDIQLVVCTELEIDSMLEKFYGLRLVEFSQKLPHSERDTLKGIFADLEEDINLKQLTVISLSVFIFAQFVMFFPYNGILSDVYGNNEKMLFQDQEGDVYYESDDAHYIDGQAYREIHIYQLYTWAEVLFCLMNCLQSASICVLAWIALRLEIEDEIEIEVGDYSHY
jgi:hypothetical protein